MKIFIKLFFIALLLASISSEGQVVLNEFMADNDTTVSDQNGEFDDWIELYNNGTSAVSLNRWFLSDDSLNLTKWRFPDTSIAPGAYVVIWADQDLVQSGLHADFKLAKGGESIFLVRSDTVVLDSIDYPAQLPDASYGRYPNGVGPMTRLQPTFNASNTLQGTIPPIGRRRLVINELMARNDTVVQDQDMEYEPWMELYNPGLDTIDLYGRFLSSIWGEPYGWAFPDTCILPGQYLIVWMDANPREDGIHCSFELNPLGGYLGLHNIDSSLIDSVVYASQPSNIAFERLPNVSGRFKYNFHSFGVGNSSQLLPSPHFSAGQIVINEFLATNINGAQDEKGEYEDWIEIYNNSLSSINLQGAYLSDEKHIKFKWPIPDTVMAPNSYLIVWADNEPDGKTHANFKLSSFGESVCLHYLDGASLDSIDFNVQFPDTAMARIPNGTGPFQYAAPSFDAFNGNPPIVLPLEIIQIDLRPTECGLDIDWLVANPAQIDRMTVQRTNAFGNWESLKQEPVASKLEEGRYSLRDNWLAPGHAFYRIKSIDISGDIDYSKSIPVSVSCGEEPTLEVFPNPSAENMTMRLFNAPAGTVDYFLSDLNGKILFANSRLYNPGERLELDLSYLNAGIYILRVHSRDFSLNRRLIRK